MERQDADEEAIQRRVADLEQRFGDPADPGNPLRSEEFLDADAREQLLPAGERMLDGFGLNAEFVPRALGGRLDRLDTMARVLRTVFRRDAALGLGYGVSSFLGAVVVWAAGSPEQQRRTAALLDSGGRVAGAYPELARGSDFLHNEFDARRARGGGYLLTGSKEAFNNVDRAGALVLFARTGEGRRSHSALLVEPAALPAARVERLPRHSTLGVRGCLVGGIRFHGCPIPGSALLGEPGQGLDLALRAFPITRSAGPSMALGCADTALRTAVASTLARGGRDPLRTAHIRSVLTGAFVDLLICDCLALVATRAVHLLPEDSGPAAAAVKYLLPQLLTEAGYDLSTVLGSQFYLRQGEFGVFQKNVRDLPMIGLGPAGSAACRATVVPQLPRLARTSWFVDPEPPGALFRLREGGLPPLDPNRLEPSAAADPLAAALLAADAALQHEAESGADGPLRRLAGLSAQLVDELAQLRKTALALDADGGSALANPRSNALADRYALVLAGAAVLGVRRFQQTGGDGFLTDPAWAEAALLRIVRRLGGALVKLPPDCEERLLGEVVARYREARSYDLYDTQLAGPPAEVRSDP